MKNKPQTVSLVLGGGGARGLVHIGVIQYLDEAGFQIRSISGTSMGALIGGIYAAGKLDIYSKWVSALQKTDVLRLLDFSFGRDGLFKGERIIGVLKELIGDRNIEDLPISFTAVATDIYNEKEIWLNNGPLFDAIRASISIPTIFTPYEYRDMVLLDGSLLNPVPVAPTLNDTTDMTIVVSLCGKAEGRAKPVAERPTNNYKGANNSYRKHIAQFIDGLQQKLGHKEDTNMGLFEVIGRSLDTLENSIARLKLAAYSPEVIIEISKDVCSFYEFHRARELIKHGHQSAEKSLAQWTTE